MSAAGPPDAEILMKHFLRNLRSPSHAKPSVRHEIPSFENQRDPRPKLRLAQLKYRIVASIKTNQTINKPSLVRCVCKVLSNDVYETPLIRPF